MGSKTLTITEDAYDRLKGHKRPDESFTDVVMRLTGGTADPLDGLGAWDGTRHAERVEEGREQLDRELEERQRELSGH